MPAFVLSASGSTPKDKCDFLCLRPFRAPQNGLPNALYLQPAYKAADAQAPFGDAPDFSAENRINPCAAQKSIVREKKEKIFSVRKKRQNRLCPRRRTAAADADNLEWTTLRAVSAPDAAVRRRGRGSRGAVERAGAAYGTTAAARPLCRFCFGKKRTSASCGRMAGWQFFFGKPARVLFCSLPKAAAPFMPAFIAVSRQKPRRAHREALWELTSPVRFGIIINILERKGTSRVHRLRLSVVGTPAFDGGLQAAVSLARTTRRPELGNAASASLRAKIYTIRAAECLEGILR